MPEFTSYATINFRYGWGFAGKLTALPKEWEGAGCPLPKYPTPVSPLWVSRYSFSCICLGRTWGLWPGSHLGVFDPSLSLTTKDSRLHLVEVRPTSRQLPDASTPVSLYEAIALTCISIIRLSARWVKQRLNYGHQTCTEIELSHNTRRFFAGLN